MKVLIAIVTTDRDVAWIPKVYEGLKADLAVGADLLVICRTSDLYTLLAWAFQHPCVNFLTVPPYTIQGRHNYTALVQKRELARKYAIENGYFYLLFVDSDIVIQSTTLSKLIAANVDVCLVPYPLKWLGIPAVGILSPEGYRLQLVPVTAFDESYQSCQIAGMGCTLLNQKAMSIPFAYGEVGNVDYKVVGEDIGYFLTARGKELTVKYLANHPIEHL